MTPLIFLFPISCCKNKINCKIMYFIELIIILIPISNIQYYHFICQVLPYIAMLMQALRFYAPNISCIIHLKCHSLFDSSQFYLKRSSSMLYICLLTSELLICWLELNGNLVNQGHTDHFPIMASLVVLTVRHSAHTQK